MASDFSAWTQKSSKWIFGSLVAVMALSLVISFGSGGVGGCDERTNREAGSIFDRPIYEREFYEARRRALAYTRWKTINAFPNPGMYINYMMRTGQFFGQDPKDAELDAKTFEMLALKQYATTCGIAVSKEEVHGRIIQLCASANIPTSPIDMDRYEQLVAIVFASGLTEFEQLVPDMMLIDKMLDLAVNTAHGDLRAVAEAMAKENREVRALVASIDPERFLQDQRQPGPGEILDYYEKNKAKFQMPEKYQVEFLLADVEKFKEKQGEPTEDELKKFYDENKALFTEGGHSADDGHDHGAEVPQGRTKPFDEVKDDVRKQVKTRKAQRAAFDAMQKVNSALGEKVKSLREEVSKDLLANPEWKDKPQNERDAHARKLANEKSGRIFGELVKDFEEKGIVLTPDITVRFTEKQFEDVENRAGKAADSFKVVDFAKNQQVGAFSPLAKTDKGSVIYRLNLKEAASEAGLSEPVKKQIIRAILADKLKGRAGKAADELVKKITEAGNIEPNPHRKGVAKLAAVSKLREQDPSLFIQTTYFRQNTSTDLGTGNFALGNAIKNNLTSNLDQSVPGHAVAIRGDAVGGEQKDWGFVAVVDDVVQLQPEDVNFWPEVHEASEREKSKRREQKVKEVVLLAAIVDKSKDLKRSSQ